MLNDKEYGNLLIDYYGSLLTNHQLNILNDYYKDDLSMNEIAENNNITRSAVSDIVKRSIKQLENYEKSLKMIKQSNDIDKLIDKMNKDQSIDPKYIKELVKINRG